MLSGVMSSNMYRLRLLSFNQEQSVSLWFSDKIACVTKIDQYAVIELETVGKKLKTNLHWQGSICYSCWTRCKNVELNFSK